MIFLQGGPKFEVKPLAVITGIMFDVQAGEPLAIEDLMRCCDYKKPLP